jgi:hypothetical protein
VRRFLTGDRPAVWPKPDRLPEAGHARGLDAAPAQRPALPGYASPRGGLSTGEPVIGAEAAATGPIILPPGFGTGQVYYPERLDQDYGSGPLGPATGIPARSAKPIGEVGFGSAQTYGPAQ